MMGYYGGDWGVGEWLAMSAMMVVFWGSVIALGVWVARSFSSGDRRPGGRGPDPDAVLAERFALGEIDEDEFRRRRETLHSTHGANR